MIWKDDRASILGSDTNPTKKIIYIPQSYLNRIVDYDEEEGQIYEIIKGVLLQKQKFKTWYESLVDRENIIDYNVEDSIRKLFRNINIQDEQERLKKELGDKGGIAKQIEKLKKEIKNLQEKSKVNKEDLDKYNEVNTKIQNKKLDRGNLTKDIAKLKSLKDIRIIVNEDVTENIISPDLKVDLKNLINTKVKDYKKDWATEIEKRITAQQSRIQKLSCEIETLENSIKDLTEAFKDQNELNELIKQLKKEKELIQQIEVVQKEVDSAKKLIEESVQFLADYNTHYYTLYLEAKNNVILTGFDDDLSFDILTKFKKHKFQESFVKNNFDGRAMSSSDYDYLTEYQFKNPEEYKTFLKAQTNKIINDQMPNRRDRSNKEVITSLFKNWFMHDYKVTFQDDDISDMSPGKKSFVLLRLLIDLDDSKWPILIDQPEDDLDNRSIYNQLVEFLRKRKKTRQIIIVTHNPNLVLGADAELIVVANQEGIGTENRTHQFEYVSGSIENTKSEDNTNPAVLYRRGIQEHICDILEGGPEAFDKRKKKYNF